GRFFARIGQALDRLFGGLASESSVLFWILVGILAALGLALIVALLYTILGRLSDAGAASARTPSAGAQGPRRTLDAAGWEEEARRLAAEGRYRDAAVALYQALLLRMEAAGAVRYDPAKTPGDYRMEARPHALSRPLAAFLRAFEPAVFGGRSLDAGVYERLRGAAAEAGARG
ncbi:DUF4129 domain-containing protein, partial [Longimicrobium sp.]|uniref:DUF4129 domain-containing protein n=1 Tax=Longimicrobium sp. TaxID=2029185 RepID=UPI002F9596AC